MPLNHPKPNPNSYPNITLTLNLTGRSPFSHLSHPNPNPNSYPNPKSNPNLIPTLTNN